MDKYLKNCPGWWPWQHEGQSLMHSTFATRWLLQTDVEAHGPLSRLLGLHSAKAWQSDPAQGFLEPAGNKPVPLGLVR